MIVEHDFIARSRSAWMSPPRTSSSATVSRSCSTAKTYTHDIIKLDLETMDVTEFVTQNPVHELRLSRTDTTPSPPSSADRLRTRRI